MKLLELFSGTGSVGKIAKSKGYEVVSVDIKKYKDYPSTHQVDILNFDYKQYEHFDIIWASPPCIYYSCLQNAWIGRKKRNENGEKYVYTKEKYESDIEMANSWVKKSLEIINHFKPKYWYIENPYTGRLRKMDFMKSLPFYVVDYCRYSDFGYRKRTIIYTNLKNFSPKKCEGKGKCKNMNGNKHKKSLGTHKKDQPAVGGGSYRLDRYRIPSNLIIDLLP